LLIAEHFEVHNAKDRFNRHKQQQVLEFD
jgi:hypothetical protein